MDRVVLSFRQQDGKTLERRLIQPGQEPRGSKVYDGSEQPDGEWMLSEAGTGLVLVNRFPKDQVSRCFADWTGKAENAVTLGLWSAKRALGPGETLKLEADYGIHSLRMNARIKARVDPEVWDGNRQSVAEPA